MFEFTGLRILHQDMKNVNEMRAVFKFEYNKKAFSCIFLVDLTPFRLYIATLGAAPVVFELEVEKGYKVKSYLDNYNKLISYLDLKYDPNHKFKPNDFFGALNRNIPSKFTKRPGYGEVLIIASRNRTIEEENKIYFCGWYSNPVGKNVRPENIEKTRIAFGNEKAAICRERNISSCWTDIAQDENLKTLNNID